MLECKHYLWDRGVSVGCHFNKSEIIQFQPFHVLLNASVNGQTLEIRSKRMELQDLGTERGGGSLGLSRAARPVAGPPGRGDGAHRALSVLHSETGGSCQPDHPQHEQQPAAADLELPVPQGAVPGARRQVQEQQGHELDRKRHRGEGAEPPPVPKALALTASPSSLPRSTG